MADSECKALFCLTLILVLLGNPVVPHWWYLSQLPLQSLSLVGAGFNCDNIPITFNERQRRLCLSHPDVMMSVVIGAKLGADECQFQFQNNRWNCSASSSDKYVFGKAMLKGCRETAFVYSISSAGVVHAITRACSRGDLMHCECDPGRRGQSRDRRGVFTWGGCSDYVEYGAKYARRFIDAKERHQRDARALINLHNNRAGRRVVKKLRKLECKCHGVSGSCTIRTCWLAMDKFSIVGAFLKHKYNGATRVQMSQSGTDFIVANNDHKRPTKNDLVYFEDSPDYCMYNIEAGSVGTAGRACNKTSLGPDGCDIMCCGRGYDTAHIKRTYKCDCKFHWCCYVKCRECEEWVDVHTCKGPNPSAVSPPHGYYRHLTPYH